MVEYYSTRPPVAPTSLAFDSNPSVTVSDFEKHRESLLSDEVEEGWKPELRRYLETMQHDIK